MIEHTDSSPSLPKLKMSYKANKLIFVLWGPQFDPVAASIFVTELRKLGLRVKIVSLSVRKMPGNNGLAIYHDMTLGEAFNMTGKASGIIVPCRLMGAQRLRNDPRAYRLFKEVSANKVPIVIGYMDKSTLNTLRLFPPEIIDDLIIYPEIEDLIEFVDQLAKVLWLPAQN